MFTQEVIIALLACIGLFIFLSTIIVRFLFLYQRKKIHYRQGLVEMEKKYEAEILGSRIEVQEATQLYIGRELHDNIGTLCSLVKINLNLANDATTTEDKQQWITRAMETVRQLITEVKQLALDLNLDRLGNAGLANILQQDIQRMEKLGLFTITLTIKGDEIQLPPDRQIILYRICQELLHNIIKHANASVVKVELIFGMASLSITISDDGNGYDVTNPPRKENGDGGSGLVNLDNRIRLIGGTLIHTRAKNGGIVSYIQLPIINQSAHDN